MPGRTFRCLVVSAVVAIAAGGQVDPREARGDEPALRWQPAGGDASLRVERHEMSEGESGASCEMVRFATNQGSSAYLACQLTPARVIDELVPSVRLRSDRAGAQILVRVVLPRSLDEGQPLTALIAGEVYQRPGVWQTLAVRDLGRQLEKQAWPLRLAHQRAIDLREAYVDRIVLNVFSGAGRGEMAIGWPELAGFVPAKDRPATTDVVQTTYQAPASRSTPAPEIKFSGTVLLIGGRPFFPRIIDHRGEPLAFLQERSFNCARLSELPSSQLLAEAARLGMWLISPPPQPGLLDGQPTTMLADFGPLYDRVLAWDLGGNLAPRDLDVVRRWAEQVRAADRRMSRPLIGSPDADLRGFSRPLSLLVSRRQPLGASLELRDYTTWIRERPRLARPGTPMWTTVETELPPQLVEQQLALAGARRQSGHAGEDQLRLLVHSAISSGVRGLHFESRHRLDADDEPTRVRAAALELVNLQLRVLEPWLSAGSYAGQVTGNVPDVAAAILKTDRAQLALPMWTAAGAQYVPGQSAGQGVTLVIPGVPESSSAYEITPAGARALVHQRVTGGTRVVLDELGLTSAVLLTQDALALSRVKRELQQTQPRAAALAVELASTKFSQVTSLDAEMRSVGRVIREADRWIADARRHLAEAQGHLQRGAWQQAWDASERTRRNLQVLARAHWEQSLAGLTTPTTSPNSVSLGTLSAHLALMREVRAIPAQANRLPGGDIEDLSRTMRAGWQHLEHPHPALRSGAEMSPQGAHSGRSCLRLRVWAPDEANTPGLVESPPLWVTSAAVPVEAGQLLRIRGWVHVPAPITGSVDGLMVFDSLGGQPLALRYGETKAWTEFMLYRVAPRRGQVTLTFALTGIGEARIDDVAIEVIRPLETAPRSISPAGRPLPPTAYQRPGAVR